MIDSLLNLKQPVVAFIPARAGSKGLPNKNIRNLSGFPLFYHSVLAASNSGIRDIYVSTDIEDIISLKSDKFKSIKRPLSLANDTATMGEVINHFVNKELLQSTTIVLLQPTSPLRTTNDIHTALKLFSTESYSMVMSVTKADKSILKYGLLTENRFEPVSDPRYCFSNRQELPEVYRPNGSIYVFNSDYFRNTSEFPNKNIGSFVMPREYSLDIDTLDDFYACEKLLQNGRYEK